MPKAKRILVAVQDAAALDVLANTATQAFDAQITCAYTGADALDIDLVETHQIAVVGAKQPDMSGFELVQQILRLHFRPVVVIAGCPTADEVIEALRLGVADFLSTPLDREELLSALDRGFRRERAMRRNLQRQQRHRSLLRRLLRDRRNLNQRIELICRDMVGAYRRVFHRILTLENHTRPDSLA